MYSYGCRGFENLHILLDVSMSDGFEMEYLKSVKSVSGEFSHCNISHYVPNGDVYK